MPIKSGDVAAPRRRTQLERTQESTRCLVEAAIDLILERGVQDTTLKEVGERAGYSRGLAGYRFGSKDGLCVEVLRHSRRHWLVQLEDMLGDKRGLDAIMAAIEAFRQYLQSAPRHYRAMVLLWYDAVGQAGALNARLAAHHTAQLRDVRRWVKEGVSDGSISPTIDPAGFATSFYSWLFGTVYQWQLRPEHFDLDGVFDNFNVLVRRALLPASD